MEIDLSYLRALIEECPDPSAVMNYSNLDGHFESEQAARNELLRHFDRPAEYTADRTPQHVHALKSLGIDIPDMEKVKVIGTRNPRP